MQNDDTNNRSLITVKDSLIVCKDDEPVASLDVTFDIPQKYQSIISELVKEFKFNFNI